MFDRYTRFTRLAIFMIVALLRLRRIDLTDVIVASWSSMAASTDVDEPDHETSSYHRSCSGGLRTLTILK